MKRSLLSLALLLAAGSLGLSQNIPHIGYVYPAGGQRGSKFQVTIGGQFLGGATNIFVSGGGVIARVESYDRPLTQREFNQLREQVEELRKKRDANRARRAKGEAPVWTPADERLFDEIRAKMAKFQRRPPNPAIAEVVTIAVNIASDAEMGSRELRLQNVLGLSNPMLFQVGSLPEIAEKPERTVEERPNFKRYPSATQSRAEKKEMAATIPVVVNGQIMAGDIDRIKFRARQGQQLVIAVHARELVPYLPDAVPGWFQATLAIFDSKGRELAYDDDFRFNPDPALFFKVPKDGEYAVELKDSIFRGREDFVYRLEIGEMPFLTGIYPLGAQSGKEVAVEVTGWNLRERTLKAPPSEKGGGLQMLRTRSEDAVSNPAPFERSDFPDGFETEPNNDAGSAQKLSLPIAINGRIDAPNDRDVFQFQGESGMELVAEVCARRLNSPLDSTLKLFGPDGKQIAFNDDFEDKGSGLTTHQADSRISTKLPSAGTYRIELADAQQKGGPEYAYRLHIGPSQPDFELRVVPSSLTLRAGGSAPLTVYALRKDGFTGEIMLTLEGDEHGYVLSGGRIPANQEQVRFTLTASADSKHEPVEVKIAGQAIIGGKVVSKLAVPSEDMMQAFFYRHLVPSKQLLVHVNNMFPQRMPIKIVSDVPVKIPCGGTATLRLGGARGMSDKMKVELMDPPEGISIQKVGQWKFGSEIVLACGDQGKAGTRGNLILAPSFAKAQNAKNAQGGKSNPLGSLPAIPFEIVAAR